MPPASNRNDDQACDLAVNVYARTRLRYALIAGRRRRRDFAVPAVPVTAKRRRSPPSAKGKDQGKPTPAPRRSKR